MRCPGSQEMLTTRLVNLGRGNPFGSRNMLYLLAMTCPPLAVIAYKAVGRRRVARRNRALLHAVAHFDRRSGAVAIPVGA